MTSARISWYSCCFLNFNSCLDPTGQSSCWAVEFWIGLPHQLQHPTATPPRHQRVLWVAKPQIRSPKGGRFIRWFWLYQYVYIYIPKYPHHGYFMPPPFQENHVMILPRFTLISEDCCWLLHITSTFRICHTLIDLMESSSSSSSSSPCFIICFMWHCRFFPGMQ